MTLSSPSKTARAESGCLTRWANVSVDTGSRSMKPRRATWTSVGGAPHGAELAPGRTSGEAPRQEARNCSGPAYRRGASPDVAGWHRVPVHTRRRDGASDSIGAAASHRQSARRKEPRLKVGDPPVSPRRDAVPDDARNRPCLPNRLIAFEHAAQIGTRESFWTRHEVGSRRADHGRKREPGEGHIRDRGSFSRPGRCCNRPTLNRSLDGTGNSSTTPGGIQPAAGTEASRTNDRVAMIVY